MAWIYLAELEELASPSKNGLDQLPIAKSTPIVKVSCCQEYPIEFYHLLQYGMTSKPYPQTICWHVWTSYMEDSRARTLALLEMELAWQESEAGYFSRSCAWPKKSSRNSYSLKMCRPLLPEEESQFPLILPRWGMIVDGVLFPLRPLERYIKGNVGLCWPTPKASDAKRGDSPSERRRDSPDLTACVNMSLGVKNQKVNLNWLEWLMGYPVAWTELKPWAMEWFLARRKQLLKS